MRVDMQIANHPCLLAGLLLTPLLCDQVLATREPKQEQQMRFVMCRIEMSRW